MRACYYVKPQGAWAPRYLYLLIRSGIAPPAVAWLIIALMTSHGRVAPGYRCAKRAS